MKQLVLSKFDIPIVPIIGLMIFFIFFVGVVLWAYRKNSNQIHGEASKLPLQEAEGVNNER